MLVFGRWLLGTGVILSLWTVLAQAQDSETPASRAIQFSSPRECVLVHRQTPQFCSRVAQYIWQLYLSQAPRFSSIESCWKVFNVCAPLPPNWLATDDRGRMLRASVSYAPPLAAVRLDPSRPFEEAILMIDRGLKPMSVLSTTTILPVGAFHPTPAMLLRSYENSLTAEGRSDPDRKPQRLQNPVEGLSPEDIYPMPQGRQRKERAARDRF